MSRTNNVRSRRRRSSSVPNTPGRGRPVQLGVQRYVPEFYRPVWGEPFGSQGVSYLTPNGPSQYGSISYEGREGVYSPEPSPDSNQPLPPLPVAQVPLAPTHEQTATIPATEPLTANIAVYTPNYVLVDPQDQVTTDTHFRRSWQDPSYSPPGGPIPRDYDLYAYQFTYPPLIPGPVNSWTSPRISNHVGASQNVDVHGPNGFSTNAWANPPSSGHASPYSSPYAGNSASPDSLSGSVSSVLPYGAQEGTNFGAQATHLVPGPSSGHFQDDQTVFP